MATQIERLEAWRILLADNVDDRQGAMEAMVELDDGVPVVMGVLRLYRLQGDYWIDGPTPHVEEARFAAEQLQAEAEVPDLTRVYPVDPQSVEDLIRDAMGAMESLLQYSQKYLAETDDPDLSSRLRRLKWIAATTISKLQQT